MHDDDLPRAKGDAAEALAAEDLAPYSIGELDQRIALLRAEISRVEAHKARAAAHLKAADALFGKANSD